MTVPFERGRVDATQTRTDVESLEALEPTADGFHHYRGDDAEGLLVDRAELLNTTVPETTVLVGGMHALGANYRGSDHGVLTDRPGTPTNDFFVDLLSMETEWEPASEYRHVFEAYDRDTGDLAWTDTRVDLSSGRTTVRAPWRESTAPTTPRRSSSTTSSTPGTR